MFKPCRPEHQHNPGGGEYLGIPAASGHELEYWAQQDATQHEDPDEYQHCLQPGQFYILGDGQLRPREERQQRNQGYDGQVLQEEDRKGGAAIGRAERAFVVEYLQAEGRRRERQSEARDQGSARRHPQRQSSQGDDRTGSEHLGGAETEHAAPHDPQAGRLQLDADDEQKEDDTELRQVPYLVHGGDETQPLGPHQGAGHQETQYRAESEALKQQHRDDRRCQQDENVGDVVGLSHESARTMQGRSSLGGRHPSRTDV